MKYKQGDRVTSSGFDGVIVRHYEGSMYEVRLPGGVCCIDKADIMPRSTELRLMEALEHASAQLAMFDPLAKHHNAQLIDDALAQSYCGRS